MELVKKLFNTTDLYSILNISADDASDPKKLKSAYFKIALITHPDKGAVEEKEINTQKFQVVKQIFELLQDEDGRRSYNETGEWPNDEKFEMDEESFGRLDMDTILAFKEEFIGSEEEKESIKKFYVEGNGDIFHVIDKLFFANILHDEERIQSIIDEMIESGELKKLGKGVDKRKRQRVIRKAKKEAEEAEALKKEMGIESLDSLKKALMKNSQSRMSFIEGLEQKYANLEKEGKGKAKGKGKTTSKKARQVSDDDEEMEDLPKPKKRKSTEPTKSKPATTVTIVSKRGRGKKSNK